MKIEQLKEKIFKYSKGYDVHVIFYEQFNNLTRFGDNEISQNVSSKDIYATVRLTKGGKSVKFTINRFDDSTIKNTVDIFKKNLNYVKESDYIYPTKAKVKINSSKYFDEKTANLSPAERALKIKKLLELCKKTGRVAYGTVSSGYLNVNMVNNYGLNHFYRASYIEYEVTVKSGNGYGKAASYSWIDDIDYDSINKTAIEKADSSRKLISVKPGKYKVILEPLAVGDLISFMGWLGFNGLFYLENKSFVNGNLGKKLFDEKLTIVEDPLDSSYPVMPFDYEGEPRKRVVLVENGVIKNVVTDKKSSKKLKFPYTGHSFLEPNNMGAIPVSMIVEPGIKSLETIIKETDRAILVTEFHYTNPLNPKTVELTGMTRNGTFLVENGKIKSAVKNLRFTQSIVEAFKKIEDISDERKVINFWGASAVCPSIKLSEFNFNSTTDF